MAKELYLQTYNRWIAPLLYHEMCHAALGDKLKRLGTRRPWHGAAFRQLEERHPQTFELGLWIKNGGFSRAVRSDRARSAAAERWKRKD